MVFISEPAQDPVVAIFPPMRWLKAMCDTCAQLDILFVVNEVITTFRHTSSAFA